jgi:hypothetical protein
MKSVLQLFAVAAAMFALSAPAATVAYWQFEEGPANANVPHPEVSSCGLGRVCVQS